MIDRGAVVGAVDLGIVQAGAIVFEFTQRLGDFRHIFLPKIAQGDISFAGAAFLAGAFYWILGKQRIASIFFTLAAGIVAPCLLKE